MPSAVKASGLALLAPLALLCLSAATNEKDRTVIIGPLLGGRDLQVSFSFKRSKYPSTTQAFFDAEGEGMDFPPTGIYQTRIGELEEDENGFATLQARIPGSKVKSGKSIRVIVGLCKGSYYEGIDMSNYAFYYSKNVEIKTGKYLYTVASDGIFETLNNVSHSEEAHPELTGIDHDCYDVKGLCVGQELGGRKVPLKDISLEYYGYGARPSEAVSAQLRLLNNVEDFENVALPIGSFATMPLGVKVEKQSGGRWRYSFRMPTPYYYSRIDLKAYGSPPKDEPYFKSDDFFLPLRQGHDDSVYRFQIVLSGAGAYEDSLVLENKAASTRSYFGNCLDSEYCVFVGGK